MAHVEASHRLSHAIEAFKTDFNGTLRSSGALVSLRVCTPALPENLFPDRLTGLGTLSCILPWCML